MARCIPKSGACHAYAEACMHFSTSPFGMVGPLDVNEARVRKGCTDAKCAKLNQCMRGCEGVPACEDRCVAGSGPCRAFVDSCAGSVRGM
jgi:hypothetical protein